MIGNKTLFQQTSAELENCLKEYKNVRPKNFADNVHNFLPTFLMVLAPMIWVARSFVGDFNTVCFVIAFFVAPVLFVFGWLLRWHNSENRDELGISLMIWKFIILFFVPYIFVFDLLRNRHNKHESSNESDILLKIKELKQQMEPLAAYPDVQNYLQEYGSQVAKTGQKRKRLRRDFTMLKISMIVIFFIVLTILSKTQGVNYEIKNEKDMDGYFELMEMTENEPFLTLMPLTTKVSEGREIPNEPIDIYFQYDLLKIRELRISGVEHLNAHYDSPTLEVYRVLITDQNGVPVGRCPKFPMEDNIAILGEYIESEHFCYDGIWQNSFETFMVLKYLKDHKTDLRFVVERVK